MCNNSLRKVCLVVASLFCSAALVFGQGQTRTITGTVVDQNNDPLIGAGVVVDGQASIGTVTDFDGNYSLTVPETATHLRFSYIGMVDQVVEIAGQTVINISLAEDATVLEGVVVTALGIKRAEKAVTYNVQKLDESAFLVREANMVNSLAGKLAGVQVNTTAAGPGGESKVVMRGAKSIANSNNALYVLDGIPLPTLSRTSPGDSWSFYSGAGLSGDGISNFNPEDFSETTALVGPSAAALYGSKAQNGILMLTSRGGREGLWVSYANNTNFSSPFMLPELQTTYGNVVGSYASWGNKLDTTPSWSVKDFFQTGYNVQHSLSVSFGGENYKTYVSASSTSAQGIIPNNTYGRKNLTAKHTADFLNNKLHVSLLGMYMNVAEQNQLAGGQYNNPLMALYLMSPADDLAKYQTYERYNVERGFKTQFWPEYAGDFSMQNPFWTVYRNLNTADKTRFLLGGAVSYDITDWMDVSVRGRYDNNSTIAQMKNYASTNGVFAGDNGRFYYDTFNTIQTYFDALLNIHKTFGENVFQLNAVLGASVETYKDVAVYTRGDLLAIPNKFTMNNMDTSKGLWKESINDQTQSVFGTLQLGLKNWLFLDLTARTDWDSRLTSEKGTKAIFYPSVGLSAILTDAFGIKSDFLSYAKIRASYAEVGNAPMRYISGVRTYPIASGGMPANQSWGVADDFSPERTQSFETGLDLRLFQGKLIFSGTYYYAKTFNQVFDPEWSGYSKFYINAGRVDNRGVELSLQFNQDLGPVKWNSNLIYTRNKNKIVSMVHDVMIDGTPYSSTQLSKGGTNGVQMWLTEGGQIGDLYVSTLKTDEHGKIYVSTGDFGNRVVANSYKDFKDLTYAGNTNPAWTGSWRNTFSWNGLSASAMITARVGGIGASMTEAILDTYGMSVRTAEARDNGGALVNGQRIPAQAYYETIGGQGTNAVGAYYIYSMTNVRLSEVSLGYSIPIKKLVPWIDELNVSAVGRNLAMFYCKAPFDPELIQGAGNYSSGIDYFMVPSTRNIGFSAKVTFGGNHAKKEAAPAPQVIEKEIIKEIVKEVVKEVPVEVVKEVPAKTLQGIYNDDLYFVIGKAEIRPDEAFKLGKIAQIMKDNPDATIEITGSADSVTGSARTNARLSEKRAQTVVNMLAKDGIPASRISYKAAVDSKPGQGAAANRVAICIVK